MVKFIRVQLSELFQEFCLCGHFCFISKRKGEEMNRTGVELKCVVNEGNQVPVDYQEWN